MKLSRSDLIWIGVIFGILIMAGTIIAVKSNSTPENDQIRQNERARTNVMRLENLINEFTYAKDKNTGVCYVMYPNLIKSLTTVPCSDRVLETIRKQRAGNDTR